jgi:hypothetical protein
MPAGMMTAILTAIFQYKTDQREIFFEGMFLVSKYDGVSDQRFPVSCCPSDRFLRIWSRKTEPRITSPIRSATEPA